MGGADWSDGGWQIRPNLDTIEGGGTIHETRVLLAVVRLTSRYSTLLATDVLPWYGLHFQYASRCLDLVPTIQGLRFNFADRQFRRMVPEIMYSSAHVLLALTFYTCEGLPCRNKRLLL